MSAKDQVKAAIATAWDAGAKVADRAPKLTILYYHAVTAQFAAAFDAQMAHLKATANLLDANHDGPLDPDRPNVAVTFDDAFRSIREHALPALQRHGVKATIYVPSGFLGQSPGWEMETYGDAAETVMSAEELKALPRDVINFGSHTVRHPHLPLLSDTALVDEFETSRKSLQDLFGETIDTLAFPYGEYDERVIKAAEAAGYRRLYTVAPQAIRAEDTATVRGRTAAEPSDSSHVFKLKVRGAYDWMPLASRLKAAIKPR